ncbi:MAG: hypothetical protein HUU21_10385 [Polyangiaceae bacterium]|nr:hypothetical protein [Polyangiaceae bacterium]
MAVFDAESPPALAFTRSLGRAGVPVIVYSDEPCPPARFSRYATEFRRCPPRYDAATFLSWLEEELRCGRIGLVAPTSDTIAFYLAELLDRLPETARRALPAKDAALDALFKDRFDAACARASAKTPWAFYPSSIEEALDQAASFPYPVILKPKSHVGIGFHRGTIAHNADELRREFAPLEIPPGAQSIIDRYPSLRLPMIQELVPGALGNLFSVSGLLGPDGELIACAASQKRGQWPPALGIGIQFESCFDPRVINLGARIAREILGRGLFELELVRDPRSDDFLAIDLNPRAYGQISLDIARGNDLPRLWYRVASGDAVEALPSPSEPVVWLHGIPYGVAQLVGFARAPDRSERARRIAQTLGRNPVDIAVEPSDPLSSLAFIATMLRHPGGLIRPFFNAPPTTIP